MNPNNDNSQSGLLPETLSPLSLEGEGCHPVSGRQGGGSGDGGGRTIKFLIIHCSAVKPTQTSSAAQIDAWHKSRGWRRIGYHYVIRRDGTIERGRPDSAVGAHCSGYNAESIGICYEGGLAPQPPKDSPPALPRGRELQTDSQADGGVTYVPADTRTPEQKEALLKLLKELKSRYPEAKIRGHNDFSNKACPCFDVKKEYGDM